MTKTPSKYFLIVAATFLNWGSREREAPADPLQELVANQLDLATSKDVGERLFQAVRAMLTPSLPRTAKPAPATPPPTAGNTPAPVVRHEVYGLGWRLGLGGKGCSPQTFGHGGATGALAWHDPTRALTFVLLTTWPSAQSQSALLMPVSEAVLAAF